MDKTQHNKSSAEIQAYKTENRYFLVQQIELQIQESWAGVIQHLFSLPRLALSDAVQILNHTLTLPSPDYYFYICIQHKLWFSEQYNSKSKFPACEAPCGTTGSVATFSSVHKRPSLEQKSTKLQPWQHCSRNLCLATSPLLTSQVCITYVMGVLQGKTMPEQLQILGLCSKSTAATQPLCVLPWLSV